MSPKPKRRAKVITTDGPVSLPRKPPPGPATAPEDDEPTVPMPEPADASLNELAPLETPPVETTADSTSVADDFSGDTSRDDNPDDTAPEHLTDEPEIEAHVTDKPEIEALDIDDGDGEAPALPVEVVRLQSELVQGAVRREQRIAEITAAVAQAISKAHREADQSATELDSLRSMLQGVASADESQSFLEIERVQTTIQATQAEWTELAQSREELERELLRLWRIVEQQEAALGEAQTDRAGLETDRNDAERRAQDLFDRLAQATVTNSELKNRLDDLVAAEDVTSKLEARIRELTAEKETAVRNAKTAEATLQQRLSEALDKLAVTQQGRVDGEASGPDPAMTAALDKAQADRIKMKAELEMLRAELSQTKAELDQAYQAETELEAKLQSAWTTADEGATELQTTASDQQRLRQDLADANKNLDMLRSRIDNAAGDREKALEEADEQHQAALATAQAEVQAALDKQARDHQAGVAALKAAHKQKLNRRSEELQEKSKAALAKLRAANADLEQQLETFERLKQDHAGELEAKDVKINKLREAHADELATKTSEIEQLARANKSKLDGQAAETERAEAKLKKLQAAHDALLAQQAELEDERQSIEARSKETEELRTRLEAANKRSVEREAELEKLRLSSDDTHQRIGTLLGQVETLQASVDAQAAHVDELTQRETEFEAEAEQLRKRTANAIEARSKVIKGAESTALLASRAETRAEELDRDLQQVSVERDAVTGALTTAEARIVNLEAELDRITNLADQRVHAAFESATALGERAIADAEAKEQRIHELEAQLSLLQRRGSGVS